MRLTVRLFAMLRERAGADSVELELAEGATVADALEALRAEPGLETARPAAGADGGQPRVRGPRGRSWRPATSWR